MRRHVDVFRFREENKWRSPNLLLTLPSKELSFIVATIYLSIHRFLLQKNIASYCFVICCLYSLYILLRPVWKTCSRHSSSICCFENRKARKGGLDEICFQKGIWIKVINWEDVNTFLSLVSCNCYGTILRELKLKF